MLDKFDFLQLLFLCVMMCVSNSELLLARQAFYHIPSPYLLVIWPRQESIKLSR